MFAVGTKELGNRVKPSQATEERRCRALLRSCFGDRSTITQLLERLPDMDGLPPPVLPPGWEQRLDEASCHIFFVDHSTCARRSAQHTAHAHDAPTPA